MCSGVYSSIQSMKLSIFFSSLKAILNNMVEEVTNDRSVNCLSIDK